MEALGGVQDCDEVIPEIFPPSRHRGNGRTELLRGFSEGPGCTWRREQVEEGLLSWGALLPPDANSDLLLNTTPPVLALVVIVDDLSILSMAFLRRISRRNPRTTVATYLSKGIRWSG